MVAWLAGPEADHISGQVIRAIGENIQLLKGWYPAASVSNGQKRWDANKFGAIMATGIFGTRNTGLRLAGWARHRRSSVASAPRNAQPCGPGA
ncbi:hypothetical protein MBOE_58690 [Mycolicibacterium boenickei]|uniref:Uncharacterized protein n=1 Tax=Mycolicibacterium boenickei TaxID=146017 RepID=A0ABM7J4Q6_9MYCO|nr:hypothetical protein MBOE_58690 [Mycolicibacterium boenickei]